MVVVHDKISNQTSYSEKERVRIGDVVFEHYRRVAGSLTFGKTSFSRGAKAGWGSSFELAIIHTPNLGGLRCWQKVLLDTTRATPSQCGELAPFVPTASSHGQVGTFFQTFAASNGHQLPSTGVSLISPR